MPLGPYEVGAIILAPTRELAKQIHIVTQQLLDQLKIIEQNKTGSTLMSVPLNDLKCHLFVGSDKITRDLKVLEKSGGCHLMIGTPGRIQLLLVQTDIKLNCKELEVLVLDEADRLLDLGFKESLASILKKLPKQRRTGLFSATMSDELASLIHIGLRNPIKVVVKVENLDSNQVQRVPSSLTIYHQIINASQKLSHLVQFLESKSDMKAILYFPTCASVEYYCAIFKKVALLKDKFTFFQLHRKIPPHKRTSIYGDFSSRERSAILMCTDIAARGLDIQGIDWVIQFDPPQDPKSFIHRCGRAGRLGNPGFALFYLQESEAPYLEFLKLRKIPLHPLPTLTLPVPTYDMEGSIERQVRAINAGNRELYEKSIPAFVSYIRFYHEHHLKFIFQLKNLDILGNLQLYGLLEIPKMPELKDRKEELLLQFKAAHEDNLRPLPFVDILMKRGQMAVEAESRKKIQAKEHKLRQKERRKKRKLKGGDLSD